MGGNLTHGSAEERKWDSTGLETGVKYVKTAERSDESRKGRNPWLGWDWWIV